MLPCRSYSHPDLSREYLTIKCWISGSVTLFQICICQLIGPVLSNFSVGLQRGRCYGLNISVNTNPYRPHTCLDLNVLKSNVGHNWFLYLCINNIVLTFKSNLNILTLNKSSAILSTHFIELIVWNNARYLFMMAVLALPLKYTSSHHCSKPWVQTTYIWGPCHSVNGCDGARSRGSIS